MVAARPLDGAWSRSCGERSPPAPRRRRRRLLFRAVRVHKIIIGRPVVSTAARRRAVADVSGARARALTARLPRPSVSAVYHSLDTRH